MDDLYNKLETWDARIQEKVAEFELDPFPQIFELCDHHEMLGYIAYSGMPARYPHWSFGKQFERQRTLYDYGLAGLPYEMVINSNPCLAYLMVDNTLLLQVLTIAHVYAHNDFFKHNLTFSQTRPEFTLENFKAHADRVRKYNENPRIGFRAVERILDAAHSLSLNGRRWFAPRKLDRKKPADEQDDLEKAETSARKGRKDDIDDEDAALQRNPPRPEDNILLFIRDNNPHLRDWVKDLLTIVHDESQYFIPQIETKIMNEGWASLWHKRIMESLDLPEDMRMEFYVRHNQVLRPIPRSLNPYYLGFKVWEDVERRENEKCGVTGEAALLKDSPGRQKLFQARESDRDESFLRQNLTRELIQEMDLYVHAPKGKDRVVSKVASDEDWKEVKRAVLADTGMNGMPVIRVYDADFRGRGRLLLVHEYDGRELDVEYLRRTLRYVHRLWGGPVILETSHGSARKHMICESEEGSIDVRDVPGQEGGMRDV